MKTNRILGYALSLAVTATAFLMFSSPHAFAAVQTWTGAGGDSNISTAANWGGTAPVNGDSITFNADTTPANRFNVINDTTVNFATITVKDTLGTYDINKGFTLNGNTYNIGTSIVTDVSNTPAPIFASNITLTGNASFLGPTMAVYPPGIIIGDGVTASSFNLGAYTLSVDRNVVLYVDNLVTTSGSGTILVSKVNGASSIQDADGLRAFSGSVEVWGSPSDGFVVIDPTLSYSWSSLKLEGGSVNISPFDNVDRTFAPNIIVNNGGSSTDNLEALTVQSAQYGCGAPQSKDVTLTFTGSLTLNSDLYIATNQDCGKYMTAKFTGAISGANFIKQNDGSEGNIQVSGSSNTSYTPNGSYIPAASSTTVAAGVTNSTSYNVGRNKTLLVNGTVGYVFVGKDGILKGSGTTGDTDVEGSLAPGQSPGCLNTGNFSIVGILLAEIGGTTACTGYDQVKVTGTVDVTGATLTPSLFGSFTPAVGQSYTIIDNDGADAVTGTFTGVAEGGTVVVGGVTYKVTYVGGSGNDVVLSVLSVPAVVTPKAPDTGMQLVRNNPIITLILTGLAGVSMMGFSRKMKSARR